MKGKIHVYVLWIFLTEAVGALSGWLTREGVRLFRETIIQPPFSPPGEIFPVVWGILFVLMGIGAARIWMAAPSTRRTRALGLFFLQLAFNFLWSIIFFNLQAFAFAFLWILLLWLFIIGMVVAFSRVDKTAARLQIPYLLWVTFAAYLTCGVWILN